MKQVLQSYRTGEISVTDVPAPSEAEPGGVLIRTTASLVSAGTERTAIDLGKKSLVGKAMARPDLVNKVMEKLGRDGLVATARSVFAKLDVPNPLGYSCAGVVVDADDAPYSSGERVACAGAKVANHAEMNAVPRNLCARIPAGLSDEEASFVTVGAIALHGVRLAGLALGERVAVIGLGLIGQIAMQLARAHGCQVLGIDLDPAKLRLANALGCDCTAEPGAAAIDAMLKLSQGRGADAVIICAATESDAPVALAGDLARDRARVVVVGAVGMNVPRRPYYDKELVFLQSRSYGPGRYDPQYEDKGVDYPIGYVRWTEQRNMESFLEAVASGRVDVKRLITHRFPIEQAEDAYRLISGDTEPFLGVVLTYGQADAGSTTTVALKDLPETSPRERAGLAFVGAGGFATGVLVPAFSRIQSARLVSIASARGVTARHVAEKFQFSLATTDFQAQLADRVVDAVVICTRHHLHADQAVQALNAGKHVFVEKPLALNESQLTAVLDAQASSGKLLTVGFNRRFSPLARELKSRLGSVRGPLSIHYRVNAGPMPDGSWVKDPAIGGGRIVGEACHMIDLCGYLTDSVPVRVSAERAGAREDDVTMLLRFADGSVATIAYVASGDPAYPKERIEVIGNGMVATLDDFRALEIARGKRARSTSMLQDKGHAAECQAFVDAVRRGGPPPIAYASLAATTRATFAVLASLATGQPVEVKA
jgi:polar amino acid transport system substrate-binding protein